MISLDEYNKKLEEELRNLLSEVLPKDWTIDDLFWIDTKVGVACPKCELISRHTEMRILHPRYLVKGYLCQLVVRCPKCRYEGTMLSLGDKEWYLEHLEKFFPKLDRDDREKIREKFLQLSEKYDIGEKSVYEEGRRE